MAQPHTTHQQAPGSTLRTLGWAFYLATSWTWCIGMYLPVLLVRDYGLWGFIAFAVPNVLGAAAMGWALKNGWAQQIIARHGPALATFSAVTIAFQIWFGLSIFRNTISPGGWGPAGEAHTWLILGLGLLMALAAGLGAIPRWRLAGGTIAWLVSAACAVWLIAEALFGDAPPSFPAPLDTAPRLLPIAAVCGFGFLLCPYLDATFLTARHQTVAPAARWAFGLGFGAFFLLMILLTLAYTPFLLLTQTGLTRSVLAIHIGGQLLFTVAAHLEQIGSGPSRVVKLWAAVLCATLVLAAAFANVILPRGGHETNESVYRLFMGFYGLVFPAYVYLCMIPTAGGHHGPRRDKLLALAGAVGLAAPMFYMGFIERQTLWLGPGLLLVLLVRPALRWFSPLERSLA